MVPITERSRIAPYAGYAKGEKTNCLREHFRTGNPFLRFLFSLSAPGGICISAVVANRLLSFFGDVAVNDLRLPESETKPAGL